MDELIDLLAQVSAEFQLRLQKLPSLQTSALTPFQGRLLAIIARYPSSSQQELGGWTGRDKAQIARTIKELEARQLVARAARKGDWRSNSLRLTSEGERVRALITEERALLGAQVTDELTQEERQIMIDALRKMKLRLGGD